MTKPFNVREGDEDTWSDIATKVTHYALFQALNDDIITRVIHCKSAHEIWSHLIVTYEETLQVKRAKIDLFRSQYENFFMNWNDSIDDMVTKFTKITNGIASLSDGITMTKRRERSSCSSAFMESQDNNIEGA